MVAYSFQKIFAPQVEDLSKRQTIRADRKRHARPGEQLQLYTAMRTRHCRKLVTPDPVCTRIARIRLEIGDACPLKDGMPWVDAVEIDGRELTEPEIDDFAVADGFSPARIPTSKEGQVWHDWVTARVLMACFWGTVHGLGGWQGVAIFWDPGAGR